MDLSHNAKRDSLSHWLWVLPILLIVAALALREIDLYPPTADEFSSMYDSGWLVKGPYSPLEILQSLRDNAPDHTPGYFMLFSAWGSLMGYDIALGRILSIFTGLLALAMTYRLTRDFIAPVAALFALIIISSSAFYNFYYAHARMYPLLVLTAAVVLWLYLRIVHHQKFGRKNVLALGIAVYALANLHAFSAFFLATLGIYHLLIVPKNRRWWQVSAVVLIALLLFSPWLEVLVSQGIGRALRTWEARSADGPAALQIWLTLISNNQPLLLLLSIVGLALAIWKKKIAFKPYLIMPIPFLLILTLFAQLTTVIISTNMRYQLVSWLPFVWLIAAGLYGLYRFRKWLGLLILLWIIAGAAFQTTANWRQYLAEHVLAFPHSPWQAISRLASAADLRPMVISYYYSSPFLLDWHTRVGYSQGEYYFDQRGLTLKNISAAESLEQRMRLNTITSPSIWIFHQTSKTSAAEAASIESIMRGLNYQLCDTLEIGIDTVLRQYAWQTLDCQPPRLLANHQTNAIDYQFYGAALQTSTVLFSDQWTAQTDDDLSGFQMSYQLISADWNKAAQLDLPLVHEGQPRLFAIDISNVPPGRYRLMAILYDKHSGQRQNWLNSAEDPPTMLTLTEMIIP